MAADDRRQTGERDPRADHVSTVLRDRRQRALLDVLASTSEDTVDLATVADGLRERGFDGPDPDLAETLHRYDLPRLAGIGVVAYDPEERTVTHRRWRVAEVLAVALDAVDRS